MKYSPYFDPTPIIEHNGHILKFYYLNDKEWNLDVDGYRGGFCNEIIKQLRLSFNPKEWTKSELDKFIYNLFSQSILKKIDKGYRSPFYRNLNGNIIQWEYFPDTVTPFNININGNLQWTQVVDDLCLDNDPNNWTENDLNMILLHNSAFIPNYDY